MRFPRTGLLGTVLVCAIVAAPAGAEDESASSDGIYGSRTDYFTRFVVPADRPDANWREYLSPLVANDNPKFSQGFEELIIRDFFQDEREGFFLDVGCWLPRRLSTTFILERNLRWSGIAIDADPQYKESWEHHRPLSRFISYAVSDKDGEILTFHAAGALGSLDDEWADKFGAESREITVETITLNTLLDREGVKKIDLLSMDIEGAEPLALAGFDIERFRPRLVCIEVSDEKLLMDYFESHGYERIEKYLHVDKINWYFRPKAQNGTE